MILPKISGFKSTIFQYITWCSCSFPFLLCNKTQAMTVKCDKIWRAAGLYLKYNVFLFLFSPFFRWRNGMDRLRMEASPERSKCSLLPSIHELPTFCRVPHNKLSYFDVVFCPLEEERSFRVRLRIMWPFVL